MDEALEEILEIIFDQVKVWKHTQLPFQYTIKPLYPLEDGCNAQTASSADTFQPVTAVAPSHLMKKCDQHPGACAGDGMPEGDARSVDIDPRKISFREAHHLHICENLGGKGFLDLDQIDLAKIQPGFLQSLLYCLRHREISARRIGTCNGKGLDIGHRLRSKFLRSLF